MNRLTFWLCALLIVGGTLVGALHVTEASRVEARKSEVEIARIEASRPQPSGRVSCVEAVTRGRRYTGEAGVRAHARMVEACMGADGP